MQTINIGGLLIVLIVGCLENVLKIAKSIPFSRSGKLSTFFRTFVFKVIMVFYKKINGSLGFRFMTSNRGLQIWCWVLRVLSLSPCRIVDITPGGLTQPVILPRSAKWVPASWSIKPFVYPPSEWRRLQDCSQLNETASAAWCASCHERNGYY